MEIERTKTKVRTEKFFGKLELLEDSRGTGAYNMRGVRRFSDVGANFGC